MDRVLIAGLTKGYRCVRDIAARWRAAHPLVAPSSKAVVFSLLLLWVQQSSFAFIPSALIAVVAIIFYSQPVQKPFILKASLIILIATALLLTSRFTISLPLELHASLLGQMLFAVVFGVLFCAVLLVKNGLAIRRREWQLFLFIGLLYTVNLLFFTALLGVAGWGTLLIFIACVYALCYEYFASQEQLVSRPLAAVAGACTLLLLQCGWVISMLPLGFSKAASFLTLIALIMIEALDRYMRGALTARWLRTSFLLFWALTLALFVSSRWIL